MADKTFVAGDVLTAADTNTYLSHTGGAWNTWASPTLQQTGTVAATTNHAVYYRAGRLIVASFRLTVTGTGTAPAAVLVYLPVSAARTQGVIGTGVIFDTTASLSYTGNITLNTAAIVQFEPQGVGVSPSALGAAGSGFTAALAVGDVVTGSLMYEAAS